MLKQMLDRFPGIGCAYMDGAGKVTTEYYGVDENTVFPAASMSKFVTALCLMKLHEDRVIDIDAPVNAWLQQWKLRTPDGQESDAAIRSIMSHTAGIVDGEDGFYGECSEISLMDILEGRTAYNNRPVRGDDQPQPGDGSVRIRRGVAGGQEYDIGLRSGSQDRVISEENS